MNLNQNFFIPILATIIPFAAFFFLIPYPIYADSFNYLNFVCNQNNLSELPGIEPFLFGLIPCNLLIIKTILFCLSALSLLAIMKTSEFWHKENAYFAGLFAIAVPFWYVFFFQFENDQFAVPFAFWALYFFVKAKFTHKRINYAMCVLCIGIAGLIWQASIVFLLAISAMSIFFMVPTIGILAIYSKNLPYLFFAYTTKAAENIFGLAALYWNWLLFGIIGLPKKLLWPTTILLIAGIFNAKLAFFALPFLAIGWTKAISNLEKKNPEQQAIMKKIFVMGIVCLQIVTIYPLLMEMPTTQDISNISQYINYKPFIEHKNDYGYGHLIKFLGGKPSAWAGGEWQQDYNKGIILTIQELKCSVLIESNKNFAGEKNGFTVYEC